jgi:hypothetical protein
MSAAETAEPYRHGKRLDVPADAAWRILTCPAGAQRWFGEPTHPGIRVGAEVPVSGSSPAQISAIIPGTSVVLMFATGRHATIDILPDGQRCRIEVTDCGVDGTQTKALAEGWAGLVNAAIFVVDQTKANRRSRQAVVVVHGIGNQRPQHTLRAFTDALVPQSQRWNKPDQLSNSYELRRYQLKRTTDRPRTDFFELYWANKVPGTKAQHVFAWLRAIALRQPRNIATGCVPSPISHSRLLSPRPSLP